MTVKCTKCEREIAIGTSCYVITKCLLEDGGLIEEQDIQTCCPECFWGKNIIGDQPKRYAIEKGGDW